MVLHYDGRDWSRAPGATLADLWSVWGDAADTVFAVGAKGTVLQAKGSQWEVVPSGTEANLYAVWGGTGKKVFAVGSDSTILQHQPPR